MQPFFELGEIFPFVFRDWLIPQRKPAHATADWPIPQSVILQRYKTICGFITLYWHFIPTRHITMCVISLITFLILAATWESGDSSWQMPSSVCHYATPLLCYIMQYSADIDVHRMWNRYGIIGFLSLYSDLFMWLSQLYSVRVTSWDFGQIRWGRNWYLLYASSFEELILTAVAAS